MVDAHPRDQRLRRRVAQALERLLGPADHAICRLRALELAELLRVVAGLGRRPRPLDRVLWRLHHHIADRVESRAPGAPGDLVELARLQDPLPRTVELGQPGEDHGADRDVDADAQRVRPADHLQQPGLGQLLHKPAVARQHAGVMDTDAAADEPRQRPAEAGGEAKAADRVGDRRPLLARAQLRRHERLRALQRGGLREEDDVDRRAIRPHKLLQELVQRLQRPGELEWHGPLGLLDEGRLAPGPPCQVLAQRGDVAERRRHEQELRVRQAQQRHLPRPTALRLGVEVKLVHHDLADVGGGALAQRDVGQHLRRAADDRGAAVDGRVTRQHPHVLGAERPAQGKELLRNERLRRRGVERHPPLGHRREVRRDSHHRLPRARRRGEDHVAAAEQLDHRLLLVRIERQPLPLGPTDERLVKCVRLRRIGKQAGETHACGQQIA